MKVLFAGRVFRKVWETLKPCFEGHEVRIVEKAELEEALSWAEVLVVPPMSVGSDLLRHAGADLRLIQQWGTGIEEIDLAACRDAGVPVCNVPSRGTGNAEGVAELAIMLMMLLARRYGRCVENVREGRVHAPQGVALWKKRVCVVGLGNLGECLVERLKGLGMEVVGVNRSWHDRFAGWGLHDFLLLEDLCTAVKGCRFVLLATAAAPETEGLMGRTELEAMGRDAFLVNVARPGLVQREALTFALEEGQIAGAGLDVFWNEPASPDDPLLSAANLVLTPHVGGVTDASLQGVAAFIGRNVDLLERGERPQSCVDLNRGD